jgi:hypothetical protein
VADEDGVGAVGIELAPRLVGDIDAAEDTATFESERPLGR